MMQHQRPRTRRAGGVVLACAVAATFAGHGHAQWPLPPYQEDPSIRQYWGPPPQWQSQQSPLAPRSTIGPQLSPPTSGLDTGFDFYSDTTGLGFPGVESLFPNFPTYPRYPTGYGPRLLRGGYLPDPTADPTLQLPAVRAPVSDNESGWPSWIDDPESEQRAATPERAMVARTAERVWVLTPDESAFIPLTFYEKFRVLESGSVVEVRNKGEFQVSFHDATPRAGRGSPRQFELSAGLQADICALFSKGPLQRDDILAFKDRLPTATGHEATHQRGNPLLTFMGDRSKRFLPEHELLVLCSKTPFRRWFRSRRNPGDKIVTVFDRRGWRRILAGRHARACSFVPDVRATANSDGQIYEPLLWASVPTETRTELRRPSQRRA